MESEKPILIVEDSEATRRAMRALLEAAGFRVACASNGREAVDYLRRAGPPDLILLDLSMPVMDGWQFRASQKSIPASASVPVVLISSEEDLPAHAASLGAADYYPKPVEFASLLGTVRALTSKRRSGTARVPCDSSARKVRYPVSVDRA